MDAESPQGGKRRCVQVPETVSTVITVTCCFLVHCTLGFSYSFGNINPYLTSYLRNRTGDSDISYTDTLWLSQALAITQNVSMPVLGLLSTRLPYKPYLLLGVLFSAGCFFGCYGGLQASFSLTVLAYGLLGGCSHAVLYPGCLNIALRRVPDKRGLVTGLVLTGYGAGAVAWNQLTTWYINQHNLQPDLTVGQDLYFTQPAVLDRVPTCFLLLGTIFTALQFCCVLMMWNPPTSAVEAIITESSTEVEEKRSLLEAQFKESETSFNGKVETREDDVSKPMNKRHDYTLREVISSRVFWTVWIMMCSLQMGTAVITNLFKAYGQTFISDDHFLTLVASFSSVFNGAGRPFWGLLADRWGERIVCLVAECVLACLVATFISCERSGEAGFFVWVCGMYLTMCGVFTMIPAIVFSHFGPRFFNINMGLMDSNGVLSAVMVVTVIPALKDSFGWHGVFFVAFGAIFVGILLNISLSIRCRNTCYKDL